MPARGIHHIDLTGSDVERSIAWYLELLGPLGFREAMRYPTYFGAGEAVYFRFGPSWFGLRPADGGEHTYYDAGVEHILFVFAPYGIRIEVVSVEDDANAERLLGRVPAAPL